jgi:hypothetical protein
MPFNVESHFLLVLKHLLSQERNHFFETFDIQSEQELQNLIADPDVQHVWKSAHILCKAFEMNLITIRQGN